MDAIISIESTLSLSQQEGMNAYDELLEGFRSQQIQKWNISINDDNAGLFDGSYQPYFKNDFKLFSYYIKPNFQLILFEELSRMAIAKLAESELPNTSIVRPAKSESPNTSIWTYIATDNLAGVLEYISEKGDLKVTEEDSTLLQKALKHKHFSIANLLLRSGYEVTVNDRNYLQDEIFNDQVVYQWLTSQEEHQILYNDIIASFSREELYYI